MIIPNYFNSKVLDNKGYLTAEWANFFQQLVSALQKNLGNEGYILPQQPTTAITGSLNTAASKGALLYDVTTDQFKVNIAGTFHVVTVT